MAEIKIKDISINGNDLFNDSEDFMNELSEDDRIEAIYGGATTVEPPTSRVCKTLEAVALYLPV